MKKLISQPEKERKERKKNLKSQKKIRRTSYQIAPGLQSDHQAYRIFTCLHCKLTMCENCERTMHVAVHLNNCILVFGGVKANLCPLSTHEIWEYNLSTEQWNRHTISEAEEAPLAAYGSCATALETDIYMFGGRNLNFQSTNELWKLSRSVEGQFHWTKIEFHRDVKLPSPRANHSGWKHAECLWVFGGYGELSSSEYLNDNGEFSYLRANNQLVCFNPCDKTWTNPKCLGAVPSPRYFHCTAIIKDNVWLFGGTEGNRHLNDDLLQLDMNSYTWTQIRPSGASPQRRSRSSLTAVSDTQLLLHGGDGGDLSILNDTWILDLPSQTWKQHISNMALPRYGHTGSVGLNNSIAILSGWAEDHLPCNAKVVRCNCAFHLMLEPKTLQQMAMKKIYNYRFEVQWQYLPKLLISQIGLFDEILKQDIATITDDKDEIIKTEMNQTQQAVMVTIMVLKAIASLLS